LSANASLTCQETWGATTTQENPFVAILTGFEQDIIQTFGLWDNTIFVNFGDETLGAQAGCSTSRAKAGPAFAGPALFPLPSFEHSTISATSSSWLPRSRGAAISTSMTYQP